MTRKTRVEVVKEITAALKENRTINLEGWDLQGVDLNGLDLTKANLTRADLTKAQLTEANLTGADLTWADLTEADLTGAQINKNTIFKSTYLGNTIFSDVKLNNQTLQNPASQDEKKLMSALDTLGEQSASADKERIIKDLTTDTKNRLLLRSNNFENVFEDYESQHKDNIIALRTNQSVAKLIGSIVLSLTGIGAIAGGIQYACTKGGPNESYLFWSLAKSGQKAMEIKNEVKALTA